MSQSSFLNGRVTLHGGDCLDVIRTLAAASIDSVVTDPPYGLEFMGKEWDAPWQASSKSALFGKRTRATPGWGVTRNANCRTCGGRMRGAKTCSCETPDWDEDPRETNNRQMRGFQDWCETWAHEVLRVLKPGGHMVAFGGTRTYQRLACAIEDAGFEIRDAIMWHYGSGFPKSLDVSKAIDKAAGAEREVVGPNPNGSGRTKNITGGNLCTAHDEDRGLRDVITAPSTAAARQWSGWGTALKPATEIIVLARKPLGERTVASNVLAHGTGALNIDACRIDGAMDGCWGTSNKTTNPDRMFNSSVAKAEYVTKPHVLGRWPANLCHDNSPEVLAGFPDTGNSPPIGSMGGGSNKHSIYGDFEGERHSNGFGDSGSAARFFASFPQENVSRLFYSSKADSNNRIGSRHPTVKPVALMQWLVRLVTPPGGTVLDPFAGSGTTGEAAWREGFNAVLIEREAEYQADIARRMKYALAGPDERSNAIVVAKGKVDDAGPLFVEAPTGSAP